ncbi:hypothetical protein OG906_35775 (plasmid) [Streptomyces sp. NBC_01426]|uniref:hypothetical protein n=1 Tax=Streptomyces sp. NBC_01426 TaxID=2975866 RepID=UPI002E36ADC5|nr:hypothetical protein [Streptomyces sp. NBC_01426]
MSTYTHSHRRTVLRAAVATAALAGALLAPSTAAFAADAPTTADAPKAATSAQTKAVTKATDGELVGHPVLADGTKGDLWKKGKGWYHLDLHTASGMPIASLHVGGPNAQAQDGQQVRGMWVTLNDSGQVHSWKNPATGHGFDAGGTETRKGCTVSWGMGTPYEGISLQLSNGTSGPVAQLIDTKTARTLTTLTTTNPTGLAGGARIKNSDDPKTPQFQMRVIGGQIPWEGVSFPKPPTDCTTNPTTTKPAAKPTAATKPTPAATPAKATPALSTHNAAQTSVLPKGGVAAGAEIAPENTGNNTALIAGGASTLTLGAAAAGFIALRRRTTQHN